MNNNIIYINQLNNIQQELMIMDLLNRIDYQVNDFDIIEYLNIMQDEKINTFISEEQKEHLLSI